MEYPADSSPDLQRPAPPSTMLAMPQLVATAGTYPARNQGDPACFNTGMIHSFAGTTAVYGAPGAQGQLIPVAENQALYSIFFVNFGTNGATEFGLPALHGRTLTGGGPLGAPTATTQPITWMIAHMPPPGEDAPLIGSLAAFGGNFVPDGWLPCDGSDLPINAQNVALYEVIGNAFGGENPYFTLPGLSGAAVVGAGPDAPVGSAVTGSPAGLCFTYLVNIGGPAPSVGGDGAFPANQYWLGQVIAYAGSQVPPGWALADGSLLPVAQYQALFGLVGWTYGGDGVANFALPDLRGKMVVGL